MKAISQIKQLLLIFSASPLQDISHNAAFEADTKQTLNEMNLSLRLDVLLHSLTG